MTTATILTSLVGSDGQHFSATQKSNAISTAQTYLNTSDGDSDAKDMATAMLAQNILLNLRRLGDESEPPQSLSSLVTDDIRSLLSEGESSETYKIIVSQDPTNDWRS